MLAHLVVKLCLVVGKNEGKAMKLKFLDFDLLLFQILSFAFIYVYLLRIRDGIAYICRSSGQPNGEM